MVSAPTPVVIWRLLDGKPGHENQSLGLVRALEELIPCQVHSINVSQGRFKSLLYLLAGHFPPASNLPKPQLIIGAGHCTHFPLLAAKRCSGGRSVLLMKPTMPSRMFDLVVAPQHDGLEVRGNVIQTQGVLNPFNAEGEHADNRALILVGGPSKHHHWNSEELIAQIVLLLDHSPMSNFVLTTSRRTPIEFEEKIGSLNASNLQVIPVGQTESGWVAEKLAEAYTAWVTEDSVSMVYEALTAGTAVGVLAVPQKHTNRVTVGLEKLIQMRLVCRFDQNGSYIDKLKPQPGFNESARCAHWIVEKWLKEN